MSGLMKISCLLLFEGGILGKVGVLALGVWN